MNTAHRTASRAKREMQPQTVSESAGIDAALKAVAIISKVDREAVMQPIRIARKTLQFGGFTTVEWADLADAFNLAEAIMQPGIRIARDHAATIEDAQNALIALRHRRVEHGSWVATGIELKQLDDAIWLLEHVQLANVSNRELTTAHQMVANTIKGARSGSPGATVVHVDNIQDHPATTS